MRNILVPMKDILSQNFINKKLVWALFLGLMMFGCGGVHNEPPSEIIRTSGAGPTSRTAPAPTSQHAESTTQQTILDSTGNPIEPGKK